MHPVCLGVRMGKINPLGPDGLGGLVTEWHTSKGWPALWLSLIP